MDINIIPQLVWAMVDGKVCSSLSEMSPQKCYICGATPKYMNEIQLRPQVLNVKQYTFDLSPLHAYIRFCEVLIHIWYCLHWEILMTATLHKDSSAIQINYLRSLDSINS
ncbi:hypothetical protein PR048_011805 [Dryococelus australis]|uniref:Uncharacterized protein n=1 Tax=Dryococelus australis TaxID=614101 RepID=A0ABQ9HMX9_9NEOP|nr:hypothetical protein PR048_011805 [Dryococelus australis]